MIIDIKEGIFEVNTSESYNKEIYLIGENLIIPYINLEIFEAKFNHPIIKKYDKLDFSYLIFKDVKEVFWNYEFNNEAQCGQLILGDTSTKNDYLTEYIDATNVLREYYGYDFEIKFKEQYLYFSENVSIKNGPLSFWMPIETPNFRKNLSEKEVQSFFNKDSIPYEVLKLVGVNDPVMLKTLDILNTNDVQ